MRAENRSASTPKVPMRVSRMILSLPSRSAAPQKPSTVSASPSSCKAPVTITSVRIASAADRSGDIPSEMHKMRTRAAQNPISAPATGKARAARLRSKGADVLPGTGRRVRNAAAVCRSSVHSTDDQSSGGASVGFSSSSIFPLSFPSHAPLYHDRKFSAFGEFQMQFVQSALPFDDIRSLLKVLPESDGAKASLARERNAKLTKPLGSLGRLEDLAEFLSAWQGRHPPRLDRPTVVVFAGNHGVVRHGVAAFPQEVTQQMVANFRNGGAAINQLCKTFGLGLKVYELALSVPTRDITEHAALEEAECVAAMAFGMEAIAGGADLLCLGEMGIGNTTIAAALCAGLFGGRGADWVGPGTGVDEAGLRRKAEVVDKALALHN